MQLKLSHSYQHLILGCRRAQLPDEDFGGIIADEMGLGKTLTILAAIFMSKGRRKRHMRSAGNMSHETPATLVILPSIVSSRYGSHCFPSPNSIQWSWRTGSKKFAGKYRVKIQNMKSRCQSIGRQSPRRGL